MERSVAAKLHEELSDAINGVLQKYGFVLTPSRMTYGDYDISMSIKAKAVNENGEVGDLLDVIKVLRESYDIKKEDIKAARKKKNKELGGFDNGYFLDKVVRRISWKLK